LSLAAASISAVDSHAVEPFAEAWLLDTHTWEWLRIAGDLEGLAEVNPESIRQLKSLLGRAGHASVFLSDARGILKKCGEVAAKSAQDSDIPIPALLLHGGQKADGGRHGDCALLTLPPVLVKLTASSRGEPSQLTAPSGCADEEDIPLGQN